MGQVRVATISYINSSPFVYGITHAAKNLRVDMLLHTPSKCVDSFKNNLCDIAIVPTAELPYIGDYKLASNYCISSTRDVRTVVLMSNTPIENVTKIYLDEDSRTSAQLIRILAREKWHITPEWIKIDANNIDTDNSDNGVAYMLIGDKVFNYEGHFAYSYDLSNAWYDITSLPFVFAVWVAKPDVDAKTIENFNTALEYGLKSIDEAIEMGAYSIPKHILKEYLTKNIEYTLTKDKRKAIEMFIQKSTCEEPSSQF